VLAKVEEIRPHAGEFDVVLGIAPATTGNEAAQLVNMLFGNCSLQPEVELVDVRISRGLREVVPGPRFGIEGIRSSRRRGPAAHLHGAEAPGLAAEQLAKLARTFALAGIDVIKDDHGIAEPGVFALRRARARGAARDHRAQSRDRRAHGLCADLLRRSSRPREQVTHREGRRRAAWRSSPRCSSGLPRSSSCRSDLDVP
jgi:ribulose-bisphosphate carboxylase large chain